MHRKAVKLMFATVRTTVLPAFSVDVYPLQDEEFTPRQQYVLVLRDGTVGTMELVFPSGSDLMAFLREARDALSAAKQEIQARKARLRPRSSRFQQVTLF